MAVERESGKLRGQGGCGHSAWRRRQVNYVVMAAEVTQPGKRVR